MDGAASVFNTKLRRGHEFDWSNAHFEGVSHRPGGGNSPTRFREASKPRPVQLYMSNFTKGGPQRRVEYYNRRHTRRSCIGKLTIYFILSFLVLVFTTLISRLFRVQIRSFIQLTNEEVARAGPIIHKRLSSAYTYLRDSSRSQPTSSHDNAAVIVDSANAPAPSHDHQFQSTEGRSQDQSLNKTEKRVHTVQDIPVHSKHVASLRDFALNTEYISGLTSHTSSNLGVRQKIGLLIFSSIAGFKVGRTLGQSPTMALVDGGKDEQSCWFFPGSSGYLGIQLKERISVEMFTVDHLPRDTLADLAILQAPRKVILWGRVDGLDNLWKERLYRRRSGDGYSNLVSISRFLPRSHHAGLFIPLAAFEYKLAGDSQSVIQTKEIPQEILSLQMDFSVVVLEIVSNWGGNSTCLYRIRIHGTPLTAVALHPVSS